ncbi:MAG: sulfatase-like hydrolase/transferase [Bryobacteraceae bacterium]
MRRRDFLAGLAAAPAARGAARPPNIVMMLVDDMGRDWVSCYGAAHRTPQIDRLAAQGTRFENAWCTPICTPTRVELLTGRYPFRTGWTDHHDVPRWGGKGLDWDREVTFARVLKQAGYATAIGGKWQVNDFRDHPDALQRHGFDEHCMWTGYEEGNPPSDARYHDPFLQINGERGIRKGKFGPEVVHEFLTDFVRRNRQRPFLVYYPMIVTHSPYVPTPLNQANPPKDQRGLYAGMVSYVDDTVGRMLRTLDELKLADNTLVIFSGDNGSPLGGVLNGVTCPGGKGRMTDLGSHTPLIARAPWLGNPGRVVDDLVDFTDILPTMAEAAGAPLPRGVKLDGRSFLPVLAGKRGGRDWIYSQRGKGRIVRDKRYKANWNGAFFDLKNDPLEKNDLAASADPEVVKARGRLRGVLAAMPPDGPPPFEGYGPRLKGEA